MSEPTEITTILVNRGILTREQANDARIAARAAKKPLPRYLTDQKLVTSQQLISAAAAAQNVEFYDMASTDLDKESAALLNGEQARRWNAIPVRSDGNHLFIAVTLTSSSDLQLRDDLLAATGAEQVTFVVAMKDEISRAIQQTYRSDNELRQIGEEDAKEEAPEESLDSFKEIPEDSKIVKFVNLAIQQGIADGASDIHIEQDETSIRIRYRIDGVLQDVATSPKSIANEVVSRIKIIADLNIAEKRAPQDGRLSVTFRNKRVDLRVSTLPTVWGEKIVLRILDNSQAAYELSDLGFSDYNLKRFTTAYTKPWGMILVTGPTGSGKSTTLYAALNKITNPGVNVVTVEDPVEYRIKGINQVQVNPKAGLTFAGALRSILRGDPDIVLVGEIRDRETATTAIEAGLTGHLVLSTLHTNDAASAITRLSEMGVEPFLVSSVVEAIVAQRLVRKLCSNCKEAYQPTEEEILSSGFLWTPGDELPTIYRARGCRECTHTGYRGRTAVHEVLLRDGKIEKMAVAGATATEIREEAISQGMKSLKQDGWQRIAEGVTSIAEILRVIT